MLFRAVEHREFSKFCKFGARYLKNGRSHKKFCLYSKSSKSGQKYIRTKKITTFFFTTLHKILPFCQKMTTGLISCTGFFQSLLIVESVSRKKPCSNSLFNRIQARAQTNYGIIRKHTLIKISGYRYKYNTKL